MAPTITPAYRLRPLGLGDILDEAFRIYRARFGLMFGTALVASIPGLIFGMGGGGGTIVNSYMQTFGAAGTSDSTFAGFLIAMLVAGAITGVLFLPVSMSSPHFAASAAALGLPATVGSIIRFAFRNYLRLALLAVTTWFMAALWFLGISTYFLVRWSFVFEVFYLERAGVGGSFARSTNLTMNAWWRIFGIRLLTKFIAGVVVFVVGLLFAIPAFLLPTGPLRQGTAGLINALVTAVLVPFPALVCTLLYLDQRVRLEALDLQLMAGRAGTQDDEGYQGPPSAQPAWGTPPSPWGQPATAPAWGQPAAAAPPPAWGEPPPSPDLPPPSR